MPSTDMKMLLKKAWTWKIPESQGDVFMHFQFSDAEQNMQRIVWRDNQVQCRQPALHNDNSHRSTMQRTVSRQTDPVGN
jgi:hypothetical protein